MQKYCQVIQQVVGDLCAAFPSILDVAIAHIDQDSPMMLGWGRMRTSMWEIPFSIPKEQSSLLVWTIRIGNPKESIGNGGIVWGERVDFPKRARLTEHGRCIMKARWWITWVRYARQQGLNPRENDEFPAVKSMLGIPDNLDDDGILEWLKDKYAQAL